MAETVKVSTQFNSNNNLRYKIQTTPQVLADKAKANKSFIAYTRCAKQHSDENQFSSRGETGKGMKIGQEVENNISHVLESKTNKQKTPTKTNQTKTRDQALINSYNNSNNEKS